MEPRFGGLCFFVDVCMLQEYMPPPSKDHVFKIGNCVLSRKKLFSYFVAAPPRLELPEHYVDGLVFRQDDIIRLKIPLVARPQPRVVWFFEDEPIAQGGEGGGANEELQVKKRQSFKIVVFFENKSRPTV